MLFNSIEFAFFLLIVFILYWLVIAKNVKSQNILLLLVSYIFYGWWNWRFVLLLIFISISNYFIGLKIDNIESKKRRKAWLSIGLLINIGILCVFKYYNFFIDSFIDLVSLFGYDLPRSTTLIILPLGISFYTFLSLSYIIDIYKNSLKAYENIVDVLLTLSFFPIILAGPIQRPASLLPQISSRREFDYGFAVDGLRQILWGLFTKVVIADNLSPFVDDIFKNYSNYSGSTLMVGAVFYSIQIYADFSGYSNIAIGIGKLMGFKLMQNFAYPYFSRDISEFWKRWHISLTTWLRDYLFIPLSFSLSWRIHKDKVLYIKLDLFIYIVVSTLTWFLTGLWHGANYTFILWGLVHGCLLILYHIQRKPRKWLFKRLGINNDNFFIVVAESLLTLLIVALAWVFFRADNIGQAMNSLSQMFSGSLFSTPHFPGSRKALSILAMVMVFMILEWYGKEHQFAISHIGEKWVKSLRFAFYSSLILAIFLLSVEEQQFIYFQF